MNNSKVKTIVNASLFAAVTAVLAQIIVPIGAVPITLAVLGAYLAGLLLSPMAAVGAMLAYLMLGAVGAPVFAGFMGGIGILFGKTGGYIIGYIFIAFFTSYAVKYSGKAPVIIAAMILGLFTCYALGTVYFMFITHTSLVKSLMFCVIPFIIPDTIKGVCAYMLALAVKKRVHLH